MLAAQRIVPLADRVDDAAATIGVSDAKIWSPIREGRLPARKLDGSTINPARITTKSRTTAIDIDPPHQEWDQSVSRLIWVHVPTGGRTGFAQTMSLITAGSAPMAKPPMRPSATEPAINP